MISFLIKYRKPVLILTVLFFLGSLGFVGVGVVMEEYGPNAPIVKVDGTNIAYKSFLTALKLKEREVREQGKDISEEEQNTMKQEILQQLISNEALNQVATKANLGVSDSEIGYIITNSPSFNNGEGFNKEAYIWTVRNVLGMNPSEYENDLKKQLKAEKYKNVLLLASLMTPQEKQLLSTGIEKLSDEQKQIFKF